MIDHQNNLVSSANAWALAVYVADTLTNNLDNPIEDRKKYNKLC